MEIALGVLVFLSAAAIDWLHVRWTQAVAAGQAHRAASLSVAMWLVSLVGFASVINVSWWLLFPEGAGFYVGCLVAISRRGTSHDTPASSSTDAA